MSVLFVSVWLYISLHWVSPHQPCMCLAHHCSLGEGPNKYLIQWSPVCQYHGRSPIFTMLPVWLPFSPPARSLQYSGMQQKRLNIGFPHQMNPLFQASMVWYPFIQRWERSLSGWFQLGCTTQVGVGLTARPAVQDCHVCQPDSLLWPPAGHCMVDGFWAERCMPICSVSWSKCNMIILFSCCTTDTISMSCKMVVTCEATVWELLAKQVWFSAWLAATSEPLSANLVLFYTHGHFHCWYRVIQKPVFGLRSLPFWGGGFCCIHFPIKCIFICKSHCQHQITLILHAFIFWAPESVFCTVSSCWFKPFF